MTAVWYGAAILTAACALWLAGCAIAGLARAIVRAVRRYAAWLRTLPTEAHTAHDAPAVGADWQPEGDVSRLDYFRDRAPAWWIAATVRHIAALPTFDPRPVGSFDRDVDEAIDITREDTQP